MVEGLVPCQPLQAPTASSSREGMLTLRTDRPPTAKGGGAFGGHPTCGVRVVCLSSLSLASFGFLGCWILRGTLWWVRTG
jgi:hypothetical protein